MAEPKTRPTDEDVDVFLANVADAQRRDDALAVCRLMEKVTKQPPVMWGSAIVGFGTTSYTNTTGTNDWPTLGFSPRKNALVLYGVHVDDEPADPLFADLGPHTTGKSCLYIKRLSDVDVKVLEKLTRNAWKRST